MATWIRFERDESDTEEFVELAVSETTLYRVRGIRSRTTESLPVSSRQYSTPAAAQRALQKARAALLDDEFEELGEVERPLPHEQAAAQGPQPEPSRPAVGTDDPRWVRFAERLREAGIDPLRSFWDQAQPQSVAGADYERKCRDANARALTCLRIADQLFATTLPRYAKAPSHDDGPDARQTWELPRRVFECAAKTRLRLPGDPGGSADP